MTTKRDEFVKLLDECVHQRNFASDPGEWAKARAAVLAAYEAARVRDADPNEPDDPPLPEFAAVGQEGQPVSSIDYWQKRGHHVCPECNGTRVRSYRQADHLGGQYVDVPCECTHPAPKADAAAAEKAPEVVAFLHRLVPRSGPTRVMATTSMDKPWPDDSYRSYSRDPLVRLHDVLAASPARVGEGAWKAVAEHIRHCVECGETDVMTCHEGRPLWEAAMSREAQG